MFLKYYKEINFLIYYYLSFISSKFELKCLQTFIFYFLWFQYELIMKNIVLHLYKYKKKSFI